MLSKTKKSKTFNLESWLMNSLRSIARRYPPIYTKRAEGKITYYVPTKMGKQSKRVKHICTLCNRDMKNDEVRIDHIQPVIPLEGKPLRSDGRIDWNIVIERLLCPIENLQKICIECHHIKTQEENKQRKALQKK